MKILFICNLISCSLGAFEDLLCALGARLHERGDSLHLALAGEPCSSVGKMFRDIGISWSVILGWDVNGQVHPWAFVLPALRLFRREKPDQVFVHFGNEIPSVVLRVLSIALVPYAKWVWVQHQQISEPSRLTRSISRIRLASFVFDMFQTNYQGGFDSLCTRGIPQKKIAVIKNGIRERAELTSRDDTRARLVIPDDAVVFIVVGSLIERKRPAWILAAFQKIEFSPQRLEDSKNSLCDEELYSDLCPPSTDLRLPTLHLVFVGDGPLRDELENRLTDGDYSPQRLKDSKVSLPSVHFIGRRADVLDLLWAADVLVHAAVAETCTYVITESMMVGIPAVVTDAGAAREQIENGVTGFVLEQNDQDGFVQRMAELARDAGLKNEMGQAARQRWMDLYTLDKSVDGYMQLIERLNR